MGMPLQVSPFVLGWSAAWAPVMAMCLALGLGASRGAIAAELSEIRERGYLIVAVKNNRPPLGFLDESGHLTGFEIEIAQRLAEELLGDRNALELVPVGNVDRVNAVIEDRVDIAIASITLTEPRRRIVSFSDPYYLDGVAFLTNQPDIQQLRNLRTAKIALLNRSSTVPHVRYILPGAQLVGVHSYEEGRRLLDSGEVHAFAGDASVLSGWMLDMDNASVTAADVGIADAGTLVDAGRDNNYQLLSSIISAEPLSIAIPKGTQYASLRESINQSIRLWYESGWLQERAAAWGLPAELMPESMPESTQFLELSPVPPASDAAPPNL